VAASKKLPDPPASICAILAGLGKSKMTQFVAPEMIASPAAAGTVQGASALPRDGSRQYPIGDTSNWEQIVANIAAVVDELDRTFVSEIVAAVDPAPEWFEPGRE
jgi:hypothetical protein